MKCLKIDYREYVNQDKSKILYIPKLVLPYERRSIEYAKNVNEIQIGNGSDLIVDKEKTIEERLKLIKLSPRIMIGSRLFSDSPSFYIKIDRYDILEYKKIIDNKIEPISEWDYVYGVFAVQGYLGVKSRKQFTIFLEERQKKKELNFFTNKDKKGHIKYDSGVFLLSDLNKFRISL